MITFETAVRIERPLEEVFAYVSDPLNSPRWNSAVDAVRMTSGQEREVGSRYAMQRRFPAGPAVNELEIVASESPREFGIRAISGPTPFDYRYRLASEGGETLLHLDAVVDLAGIPSLLGPFAGRAVRRGVDDNLEALKRTLETGAGQPVNLASPGYPLLTRPVAPRRGTFRKDR